MPLTDVQKPAISLSGGFAWFAEGQAGAMVRVFASGEAITALTLVEGVQGFTALRPRLMEIASAKLDGFRYDACGTVWIRKEDISA